MTTQEEQSPLCYEFGGFRLDPMRRRLVGPDGEPITLKPKVFDTLVCLLEHAGEPLSKRALMQAVWGRAVVEENALNQHVSALRRVLGEHPGENRFIVTMPGSGYRFVATVRREPVGTEAGGAGSPARGPAPVTRIATATYRIRSALAVSLLGAALIVLVSVGLRLPRPTAGAVGPPASSPRSGGASAAPTAIQLHLNLPAGLQLAAARRGIRGLLGRPSQPSFAFSPDGRAVVYSAWDGRVVRLYRRRLNQRQAAPIPGTEGGTQPFVSPDGRSIGFRSGRRLKRVPIDGGEVRTIAGSESGEDPARFPAAWTREDDILITKADGIYALPAEGGEPFRLTRVASSAGERAHIYPRMLPGGDALVFNVQTESNVPSEWPIVVERLDAQHGRVAIARGNQPTYVRTGHIVFARGGALWAVPFDSARLEVTGAPVVVLEDVMHGDGAPNDALNLGAAQFSVSETGRLAYVPGGSYPEETFSLTWVDRQGRTEPLPLPRRRYLGPRFSPDGTRLAYMTGTFGRFRLWVYDIGLETATPLTSTGQSLFPIWSPDGRRLAFASGAVQSAVLLSMASDGSREPERIGEIGRAAASSWSVDNVLAYVHHVEPGEPLTISTVRMDAEGSGPEPFHEARAWYPEFSPDGDWMAYVGWETGNPEIYVRSYPAGRPVYRVSSNGGLSPLWSADGRELFYRVQGGGHTRVFAVDVTTVPTFERGRPRQLFEGSFVWSEPVRSYDVSPDGNRFVMVQRHEVVPEPVTSIHIALDWFAELENRLPSR